MKVSKQTIAVTAKYSDDGRHRYLLRKQWDKELPEAAVITINPVCEDEISQDLTSMLVLNNVSRLGYGSVSVVNLYSMITPKIRIRWYGDDELTDDTNDSEIIKAAERSDIIIIAWGSFGHTTQRVINRKKSVIDSISAHKDKIFCIADEEGRTGLHPLTPSVRAEWMIREADINAIL